MNYIDVIHICLENSRDMLIVGLWFEEELKMNRVAVPQLQLTSRIAVYTDMSH